MLSNEDFWRGTNSIEATRHDAIVRRHPILDHPANDEVCLIVLPPNPIL